MKIYCPAFLFFLKLLICFFYGKKSEFELGKIAALIAVNCNKARLHPLLASCGPVVSLSRRRRPELWFAEVFALLRHSALNIPPLFHRRSRSLPAGPQTFCANIMNRLPGSCYMEWLVQNWHWKSDGVIGLSIDCAALQMEIRTQRKVVAACKVVMEICKLS